MKKIIILTALLTSILSANNNPIEVSKIIMSYPATIFVNVDCYYYNNSPKVIKKVYSKLEIMDKNNIIIYSENLKHDTNIIQGKNYLVKHKFVPVFYDDAFFKLAASNQTEFEVSVTPIIIFFADGTYQAL
jgi:hypothetical protein